MIETLDFNVFQLGGLIFLAAAAFGTLAASLRNHLSRRASLSWLLVWLLSAIALRWPETTKMAANALGISRGADLVFYCAILAALMGFFALFLRLRQAEVHITELTRRIAILHAQDALHAQDVDENDPLHRPAATISASDPAISSDSSAPSTESPNH